jgi:hypothetical protein
MNSPRPWVSVATCCEKVLTERDGVLSAIRIVDTFNVEGPIDALPPLAGIPVSVLIVLKSGDVVGESHISLFLLSPDGTRSPFPEKMPVMLGGAEQGASLVINFFLPPQKPGLYWVEVRWNDELLTKIAVKLVLVPIPSEAAQTTSQ